MLKNVKYLIYKDYGFRINYELLYDLYSPIIGSEATNLYINLFHDSQKAAKTNNLTTFLKDFQDFCGLNQNKFDELRAKLEAIGLLATYLQENISNEEMVYHFVIKEPLSFEQFIDNQKAKHLLINSIGQLNYEKLEYMYMPSRIPSDATNVSSTFEMVFNDKDIENVKNYNFDKLYKDIAKNTSTVITLNNRCRQIIENYYENFNLSSSEIEHAIYSCIVESDTGYEADPDLLQNKLHEYVTSAKNVTTITNLKLHRNASMFIKNLSLNDKETIFNEYMNLNAEQYLSAIYKTPLITEELETINQLRKTYKIPDYLINLLVDFTIFKTNGKLNKTYITKIAKTINGLNLSTLNDVYNYFVYKNESVNQILNSTKKEETQLVKINWDEM